jgi:hypothetical protein
MAGHITEQRLLASEAHGRAVFVVDGTEPVDRAPRYVPRHSVPFLLPGLHLVKYICTRFSSSAGFAKVFYRLYLNTQG